MVLLTVKSVTPSSLLPLRNDWQRTSLCLMYVLVFRRRTTQCHTTLPTSHSLIATLTLTHRVRQRSMRMKTTGAEHWTITGHQYISLGNLSSVLSRVGRNGLKSSSVLAWTGCHRTLPSTPKWCATTTSCRNVIWNQQRTVCCLLPSASSSFGIVTSLYVGTWHAIFTWTSKVRHMLRLKNLTHLSIKTSMPTVIRLGKTRYGQVLSTSVLHSITNRISRFLINFHSICYLSLIG